MKTQLIRILVADDHPIFRQGLRQVIEMDVSLRVVAEAANGAEVLTQISQTTIDVALIDVDMPVLDGFETASQLLQQKPSVKIIFLTFYKDEMHLSKALNIGASGYLVKDSAAVDVVSCIKSVVQGIRYISPTLSDHLLQRRLRNKRRNGQQSVEETSRLTMAESRILRYLADYKTNKEIANELGISVRTVENHRANMCDKLGLRGTHALVQFAIKRSGQAELDCVERFVLGSEGE
jgi:DNA-binding NarL/FixJ family response regulator